eukprot:GEMP01069597.1.p1 GENE.GEMP01069597.1~~GEMP01069597.1.p1  ORF type:complete len:277 (+),score=28.06 GEMP01069597.1:78-833(+)
MFALLFFAVATTEGPCDAAHDASKCRIANDVVDDCCAGETEGPTCARGYEYSRGNNTSNCLAPYLLVTCCIPSALFTPTTTTTTSTTTSSTITISSTTTTSFTTTSTAATTTTTATTTTSACAGLRRRKCRRNASCRWTKRHKRNRRHRRRKRKCVGKPGMSLLCAGYPFPYTGTLLLSTAPVREQECVVICMTTPNCNLLMYTKEEHGGRCFLSQYDARPTTCSLDSYTLTYISSLPGASPSLLIANIRI